VIRVLVADDHPVVRRGLRQILTEATDISVDGEAGTAQEIVAAATSKPFDVVLLDLKLGDVSGLEVLAQLKAEKPKLPVLVLSIYPEDQYGVRSIRAGAAGFLNKEAAPERLIAAIRQVASGRRYLTPALAEALAAQVAKGTSGAPHQSLSDRELQVLEMIAAGRTVGEIAKTLHRSVKTISTHRTRLLAKMGMKTNAELTHYAVTNGLVS
jgi:two-component system, NarL family, invasion response regulator UvrY